MDEEAGPYSCSGLQDSVWDQGVCGGRLSQEAWWQKEESLCQIAKKGQGWVGVWVWVCVCVCVCVFNKRKDSSMKEDVRNTIRLTHLSPASRSSSTVRGCYASATNTQGTQKCLEMTTYLAEKELQNIQSDQCGWKKEHHVQV